MQPIMEVAWEDGEPTPPNTEPYRMRVLSSNFYPLTVLCWVLSVLTVGVVVGFFCTEFIHGYTTLLRSLGT